MCLTYLCFNGYTLQTLNEVLSALSRILFFVAT